MPLGPLCLTRSLLTCPVLARNFHTRQRRYMSSSCIKSWGRRSVLHKRLGGAAAMASHQISRSACILSHLDPATMLLARLRLVERSPALLRSVRGMAVAAGRRVATLVGCNYRGTPYELHGCINDVVSMRETLVSRFGFHPDYVQLLTDAPGSAVLPTGTNIRAALWRMVDSARPGDVLYFHYSGHGTLVPHMFRQDEAIVPSDFNLITDVDFRHVINRLPRGASFTMLSDSCHSGGLIYKEKQQIGPWAVHYSRGTPPPSLISITAFTAPVSPPSTHAAPTIPFTAFTAPPSPPPFVQYAPSSPIPYTGYTAPPSPAPFIASTAPASPIPFTGSIAPASPVPFIAPASGIPITAPPSPPPLTGSTAPPSSPPLTRLRYRFIPCGSILQYLASHSGVASPNIGDHLVKLFGADASLKFHKHSAAAAAGPDDGILLSGCQTNETSADILPEEGKGGKACGAFSAAVEVVLRSQPAGGLTNREVVERAREVLQREGFEQHPCLYCSDRNADAPFLAPAAAAAAASSL